MKEFLKLHIAKHLTFSNNEIDEFCNLFQAEVVKKKSFLLKEGNVCNFEGFVTKGLLKVFHVDKDGVEQIVYFAAENWWVTDIDSFTNEKPSSFTIQALEDSEVLIISKKDKEYAYANLPSIEKLFRIMTQKTFVEMQRKLINTLSKTSEQRYIDFIQKYPQLSQRLSNLQIAAYLGISHEFVSKIRKKIFTVK
jgi:CRP-like cAMP-binding protein